MMVPGLPRAICDVVKAATSEETKDPTEIAEKSSVLVFEVVQVVLFGVEYFLGDAQEAILALISAIRDAVKSSVEEVFVLIKLEKQLTKEKKPKFLNMAPKVLDAANTLVQSLFPAFDEYFHPSEEEEDEQKEVEEE
jgi:hypothetical protein